jgi:hypothetical protein
MSELLIDRVGHADRCDDAGLPRRSPARNKDRRYSRALAERIQTRVTAPMRAGPGCSDRDVASTASASGFA